MVKRAEPTLLVDTNWRVVRTVELASSASNVWDVVGGFYTMHLWHPDISKTEVPTDQTAVPQLRRLLTFPGQPTTTEELVMMDTINCHYTYRWHAGEWGERIKNYLANLRVFEVEQDKTCMVQWSSTFTYTEDALTEFYCNGFRALQKRFGIPS